jgi:response regulator RpfG family c-di-GMP phosphodiesterase
MTERILCVDDDANILLGYQRALRKRFQIEVALGGEEGLAAIREQGPYAVVVADMRMPGMNGVELLTQARQVAPDTVRMMLTGNSDQQTALEAVNEGHIFRFMTKPCAPENFAKALDAGLVQHRLIVAERELLSKTLSGAVKMLTDVLSLASPTAFGRASRVRGVARKMAQFLGETEVWMIEIAAMLSQVGCVAIADEVLARHYCGEDLSRSEKEAIAVHPLVGRDLLRSIPRLEGVAEIIGYQEKRFDGEGMPLDDCRGKAIPLGSRILKVALDFDALVSTGLEA